LFPSHDRSRHELMIRKKAVFITLTYNNKTLFAKDREKAHKAENLMDRRGRLCQEDMQKFFKRLRKKYSDRKLTYIYCGEYGERRWRPHYHAVIFGIDYLENVDWENIWGLGHVDTSNLYVTDNAIQYVIGYVKKKIPGRSQSYAKYEGNNRPAPYLRASQGLGGEWSDLHIDEWSKTLELAYRGYTIPVPRYYIKRAKKNEGRTIKYVATIEKIGGNTEQRFDYKTIENPDGYYTKLIRETQEKIQSRNVKQWGKKYDIPEDERIRISEEYSRIMDDRNIRNIIFYEWSKTQSDTDLERLFSSTTRRIRLERDKGIENEAIVERMDRERLKSIAKLKEYNYKNGLFGKRDKLEMMEDLLAMADGPSPSGDDDGIYINL